MAEAPPTDAMYYREKAALEFQEKRTGAGTEERERNARAQAAQREGEYSQAEPGSYKRNQERANNGGIMESGINAKRRGGIAADYANKRFRNQMGLKETEEGGRRARQEAKEGRELGEGTGVVRSGERTRERILQENQMTKPYSPPGTPPIPAGMTPPPGYEYVNGLTVPIGTKTVKPRR